nr:glycoside hydrolase family 43 protein [Flammeovirga sp. MY04]
MAEYTGNPAIEGWYADPEGVIFDDEFWIYPTYSDHYQGVDTSANLSQEQKNSQGTILLPQYKIQTFFDAFSSKDLKQWKKHSHVLDLENIKWGAFALWAPSIIEHHGKYFLFFSVNDIQKDEEVGGIGIAVSDRPEGPFKDYLGKPLISEFHNKAQPIDQFVYKDDSGQIYMYYGGWRHCNVVKLSDDLTSIVPFEDGELYKEITPENYTEGPFVMKRKGKYYFMWSEGGWMRSDYSVAYAIGDSPVGPFKKVGKILQQDQTIGKGAGHHSVISIPDKDLHYIVYHKRPINLDNPHSREVCIDSLLFDENGYIKPIKMTKEGVKKISLGN